MLKFIRKRYNAGFVRGVKLGKINERYRIIRLIEDGPIEFTPLVRQTLVVLIKMEEK